MYSEEVMYKIFNLWRKLQIFSQVIDDQLSLWDNEMKKNFANILPSQFICL